MRVGSIADGPHQPSPQKPAPPVIEALRLRWQVAASAWAVGVTIGPTARAARRCRAAPLDSGRRRQTSSRYTAREEGPGERFGFRVRQTQASAELRRTLRRACVGQGTRICYRDAPMTRRGPSASTFQTDPAVRRGSCRRSSGAPRSSSIMAEGRSDLGLHPPAASSLSTAPRHGNASPSLRV